MKKALPVLLTAAIFVFYFFHFVGIGVDYWDTYIAAPATFIAGQPAVFVDQQGQAKYAAAPRRGLPADLVDKQTFGIVSQDQRIGAGVTFAIAYLAWGVLGFRLLYAGFGAMTFLLSFAVGRRLWPRWEAAVGLGLLVAINPLMLAIDRLNANFIAVPILMGLLALLLEKPSRWLLAGLVYGALGGIRNEAIVLAPALALYALPTREGRRGLALMTAGALSTIAPYLAWNKFAFGKCLIHSSQYDSFVGFRPEFAHRLFGWQFKINGLFNWPFHDHLVRTPHYPFPTYWTLPLVLILCFGAALSAAMIVGWLAQWRADRRLSGLLTGWIVCGLGLFLFQENWEEPKTTFAALVIGPLAVLAGQGVAWLVAGAREKRRWLVFASALLVVEGFVLSARLVDAPVDERWYERFPKAKIEAATIGCLSDEQRREWMFFHTDECAAELAEQRRKLTGGTLWPRLYYPLPWPDVDLRAEWLRREPPIFDVWDHIYGY